jgi:hypothetical protein
METWEGVFSAEDSESLVRAVNEAQEFSPSAPAKHPWFAEPYPDKLQAWLLNMLRPEEELVKIVALQTFEGQAGRVLAGRSAWVSAEYAEALESRRLALKVNVNDKYDIPDVRVPPGQFVGGGVSFWRWMEQRLWRGTSKSE